MGRRKRRRDDGDFDLEESYANRRASSEPIDPEGNVDADDGNVTKVADNRAEEKEPKKPKVDSEQEKIEALRRKKQDRKQRQKEKKAERAKQVEAQTAKQAEAASHKAKEKQVKMASGKVENTSNSFITLRKGVQYQDMVVGKGPMVVDRKKVRVSYTLRAKNRYGKILDASHDFGFRLGRGEVIDGWDIGVQGMRQGGKRHIIVPPQAGYGMQNIGGGKGAILFFEVTVLAC